jgi:hypothetical protein
MNPALHSPMDDVVATLADAFRDRPALHRKLQSEPVFRHPSPDVGASICIQVVFVGMVKPLPTLDRLSDLAANHPEQLVDIAVAIAKASLTDELDA